MNLRFSPVRFKSNSTAAALAVAAAVMLVPANLLPVLSTETSGYNRSDTIFSGTVELWRQGLWVIATIVFTDRKSTRLNSRHLVISYAVFCLETKHGTTGRGTAGCGARRGAPGRRLSARRNQEATRRRRRPRTWPLFFF